MKPHALLTLTSLALLLAGLCPAHAGSGWTQTASGSYNFFNPNNWDGEDVNGVFGPDLTISGSQTISLTNDWTGTFKVNAAISQKVLLQASGGPWTVTINDDLDLQPASMSSDFTFGDSANATKAIHFDLGGADRNVAISGTKWIFNNRITNGGLVFNGNGTFTFRSASGTDGAITLNPGSVLATSFTSGDKSDFTGDTAITRAASLTLKRGHYYSNLSYVNAEENIPGMLTVDGSNGGVSVLQLRCNSKHDVLTFGGLTLTNGGVLLVHADNLGADPDAGVQHVFFTSAPSLTQGLIPGVIAAPAYGSNVTGASYDHTFVTYDSEKGLTPLAATDYAAAIQANAEPVHLRVAAGTTMEITAPVTVTSLFLEGGANLTADTVVTGTVPVTVTSGQVMMQYNVKKAPVVAVPLEFGTATGYFYYGYGKTSSIKGEIGGTGGLVFTQPMSTSSAPGGSVRIESKTMGENTYTGDTYINGTVLVGDVDFLPSGSRTGDVYVNGKLQFHNKTINGLYGSGTVATAYSSSNRMTLGDNDADGDFTGDITFATIVKTGTGTQRFGGTVTCATALNVNAGTVVADGTITAGAVNVAAGAALGGAGSITGNITFAEGSSLAVAVTDGAVPCLTVNGEVTGSAGVVVSGELRDGTSACILRSTSPIAATVAGTPGGAHVEKRENDTELWLVKPDSAIVIVFR